MEPVEINAGAYYLRALRGDERVDDRPALAELGESDPAAALTARDAGWARGDDLTWAACRQTDVELLAEIRLAVVWWRQRVT